MKQKVPPDKHINQWIWIPRMTRDLEGPYKALALLGCRNTPDRLSTRGTACVTLVKVGLFSRLFQRDGWILSSICQECRVETCSLSPVIGQWGELSGAE